MAHTKEADTVVPLFLRVPPQLKELLDAAVDHMNSQRTPGSPAHTLNSVCAGVMWTFFGQGEAVPLPPRPRFIKRKARAK